MNFAQLLALDPSSFRRPVAPVTSFIITVKTDNAGASADNEFYLPIYGSNFTVKTSDGQTIENNNAPMLITFPAAGTYDIEVSGVYECFQFDINNPSKLIDVKQFGTNKWTSMYYGFFGCNNLTGFSATDKPDLSNVEVMSYMFYDAIAFNGDISNWNVSNVTNMDGMFSEATSFNQDLSQWCVRKITAKPSNLDNGATSWTLPDSRPVWGTCPRNEDGLN